MKPLHRQEQEQFKKLFQQEDVDRFEDRFKILAVFLQTEQHVTVDELQDLLKQNGHQFQRDFVRSTLLMMCRYGFAQKNTFEKAPTRYEHRHLGDHHDHMICIKCGKIIEFANSVLEDLQLEIAASRGFHMLQHKMEIYGICRDCQADRTITTALESAQPGERVVITDILGGGTVQMRLTAMGLRRGDIAEIITNYKSGQIVIALDQKRYSLGRGLARKILVQPASSEDSA
ncbi:MAG: transcriptional repressor [Desulfobacterales bacterium]|jgi:Fur family ferric uptake transcriptional regulator|nr:transcriptional repressor [Desulfobacterales bacterium]